MRRPRFERLIESRRRHVVRRRQARLGEADVHRRDLRPAIAHDRLPSPQNRHLGVRPRRGRAEADASRVKKLRARRAELEARAVLGEERAHLGVRQLEAIEVRERAIRRDGRNIRVERRVGLERARRSIPSVAAAVDRRAPVRAAEIAQARERLAFDAPARERREVRLDEEALPGMDRREPLEVPEEARRDEHRRRRGRPRRVLERRGLDAQEVDPYLERSFARRHAERPPRDRDLGGPRVALRLALRRRVP